MATQHLPAEPRGRPDRRRRPTTAWDSFRLWGRRRGPRRADERRGAYFVDLIDVPTFGLAVLLVTLTVVDGAATLVLLGAGCEEINPAMSYLLRRGPIHFLMGKYLITAAGLPFLVIFRNVPIFGDRFKVGRLLPIFVALYLILLAYQVALLTVPDVWTRSIGDGEIRHAAWWGATRRVGLALPATWSEWQGRPDPLGIAPFQR